MAEEPLASRNQEKAQVPARRLGRSFAVGIALAVIDPILAFALGLLIYPLFRGPSHEVADVIVVMVAVAWVLAATQVIAGIVLRARGRVGAANASFIGALLFAAFLLILGILTGVCRSY
jgi:O-antigen/teichoic acid export membrane protein